MCIPGKWHRHFRQGSLARNSRLLCLWPKLLKYFVSFLISITNHQPVFANTYPLIRNPTGCFVEESFLVLTVFGEEDVHSWRVTPLFSTRISRQEFTSSLSLTKAFKAFCKFLSKHNKPLACFCEYVPIDKKPNRMFCRRKFLSSYCIWWGGCAFLASDTVISNKDHLPEIRAFFVFDRNF